MRAVEFKSRINNNQIPIPEKIIPELATRQGSDVRIIVLLDEPKTSDDMVFEQSAQNQFLKGYAKSDSVYDSD